MSALKRRRFPVEVILPCVRWYRCCRSGFWRVDETCVRAGGQWKYLWRAVDKQGG
jgi:transposase-like protein